MQRPGPDVVRGHETVPNTAWLALCQGQALCRRNARLDDRTSVAPTQQTPVGPAAGEAERCGTTLATCGIVS